MTLDEIKEALRLISMGRSGHDLVQKLAEYLAQKPAKKEQKAQ